MIEGNEKTRMSISELEQMTAQDLVELLNNIVTVIGRMPSTAPLVDLRPAEESEEEPE